MCNKGGCTDTVCSVDIAPTIIPGIIISYNNVNTICIFIRYKFDRQGFLEALLGGGGVPPLKLAIPPP